jgi:hypothetical protein
MMGTRLRQKSCLNVCVNLVARTATASNSLTRNELEDAGNELTDSSEEHENANKDVGSLNTAGVDAQDRNQKDSSCE